ncbi:MAG TPA: SDR family NAD(P)-dependent oxidoreductase, partial [Acidimicrobiales bacterium]
MDRFTGKVAIVTGAGSGIGQATAVRLASEGGSVACFDIDGGAAEATAKRISADGGTAVAVQANVADKPSVTAGVARVAADLGPPAVLCNIA